jgi:hypothetical protein
VLGSASEDYRMRYLDIARASALIGLAAVLSACPKKDNEVVPEPAAPAAPAQPAGASDKAGAEPPAAPAAPAATPAAAPVATPAAAAPAAKPKKKEDPGGW